MKDYRLFQKLFEPVLKNCTDINDATCSLVDEDCVDCDGRKQRQSWTKIKQRRALRYVCHLSMKFAQRYVFRASYFGPGSYFNKRLSTSEPQISFYKILFALMINVRALPNLYSAAGILWLLRYYDTL